MAIEFRSLSQMVQIQLDYITANAPVLLSQPLGPFVTAVAYSTALVALVLQRFVKLVLQASRLTTAIAEDVDTFVGDYGLSRLPAVRATGFVTFSRFVTAPAPILIPVGTIVQTSTFPVIEFEVIPSTEANFDEVTQSYILAGGNSFVGNVLVQALLGGANGNVAAAAIDKIGSPLLGIDVVTNGAAFVNGVDIESDEDLRFRFALYIQSLTRGTAPAILSAVHNIQQGLIVSVFDPADPDNPSPVATGEFNVIVDDGSGSPPAELISNASSAVDAYRPVGVRPIVTGPSVMHVAAFARIMMKSNLVPSPEDLRTMVRSAIAEVINTNPIGETFHHGLLYKAIWQLVSPGDSIVTFVRGNPLSTTTTISVLSTEGMATGQLVQVANATTATGALAKIQSIDDANTLTLDIPLTTAPAINATVTAFSLAPGQIVDMHDVFIGARSGNTTSKAGAHTSTRIYLNSISGFVVDHCLVIHGGAGTGNYQSQTGGVIRVSAIGADYIDVTPAYGLGYDVGWVAGGMVTGVTVVSAIGGVVDVIAATTAAVRTRVSGPRQIYVGIELI